MKVGLPKLSPTRSLPLPFPRVVEEKPLGALGQGWAGWADEASHWWGPRGRKTRAASPHPIQAQSWAGLGQQLSPPSTGP